MAEELSFRKAKNGDIEDICGIYSDIHDLEERGIASIGWKREIYPTEKTVKEALKRGDLYICERDNEVVATAVINFIPAAGYEKGNWRIKAAEGEYAVLHTLCVKPSCAGGGVGRAFVAFYEKYAEKNGCKSLRMDTNEKNKAARSLYKKLGYEEIGNIPCDFNGLENINLILLEKGI